jgi:hypothetical protein
MSKEEKDERREAITRLRDLSERAEKGEQKAVPELRKVLRQHPDLIFRFINLAGIVEDKLLDHMIKEDDLASREFMRQELRAMREEVAGEEPSPLERLLAERVAMTYLEVQHFDALYAQNMRELTIPQHEFHQKRLDKAHRRHLSAIKTLAQVRKLLKGKDVTQINIAEQQMNFAKGS